VATFAFRAVDLAGVPSRGELEAGSKAQVTEQLRQRGLIVLDVAEKHESLKLESLFQRFKSVNLRNLSVFSRQFATLIASGMPMLRSLYTLEEQTEDEMLKGAISSLRQDVEAGSSVAAAMESQPGVFDPLYRSMVNAGEGSGRLEEALDRVAHQLEKLDALRRQVKSALMYPAVVFGLALVVMIVVVAVIVPVFVGIFEEIARDTPGAKTDLPFMTQITVGVSDFVTGKWFILVPTILLAIYAFIRWKKTERGRMQWDRVKLRFPFHIGDVVQKVALARWSRTFSGTVASGVPILQAIQISGETAGNAVIQEAMEKVYASVKRGGSISRPLEEHDAFPPMVSHMISVGEDSGQLETMLEKVADFYEAEVDAKVKALTSLIEPVMIMFVGGIVGFIVISMYLPIFQLYDEIR
jgi:type IV pilus assembly protein PilC